MPALQGCTRSPSCTFFSSCESVSLASSSYSQDHVVSDCLLSAGLGFAAASTSAGILVALPSPFDSTAMCLPRVNVLVGALKSSLDLAFIFYLAIRFFVHDLRRDSMASAERSQWRRMSRTFLQRRYAKLASLAVLVASAVAGVIGRTSQAGTCGEQLRRAERTEPILR